MDILQIFGDYIHLLGMLILLIKLWVTGNCTGISGKTQLLNAIVFTARYTDLAITYISLYNTIMKIIFTSITYCTVVSIYFFFRKTYDRKRDAFRMELLILPSTVLALFMTRYFVTIEVFWTFSIFLEAVAIVPQVYMVSKSKQVESIIISYISCLGLYRGFYLMHWLYNYLKMGYFNNVSFAGSIIQLIFYCDFFARNLPIFKLKNHANDSTLDMQSNEETKKIIDVKDQLVDSIDNQSSSTSKDRCISMHSVIILPSDRSDITEKITLLSSKEQSK